MEHEQNRLGNDDSSPDKRQNGFDPSDDVLVEVFKRLPLKSLIRFQLVSNHWADLISDVRRSFKEPWAFMYLHPPICYPERTKELKFLTSSTCENPFFKTGLPFLPNDLKNPGVTIEASFNDMVLFKNATSECDTYYICNPFTKQYRVLPPPSVTSHFYKHCCLISEPLPSTKNKKYNEIPSEFRFRVVIATCVNLYYAHSKNLAVEIYSSETGTWTRHSIPHPNTPCCMSVKKLVAGCGKILMGVHSTCHDSLPVMFDPFKAASNNLIEVDPVGLPSNRIQNAPMDVFPSQGRILLCQTPLIHFHSDPELRVWELNVEFKTNDEPPWKLIHRVDISEMDNGMTDKQNVDRTGWIPSLFSMVVNRASYQIRCVGFNPLDANVMYLSLSWFDSACLAIYDMRTKAISEVPEEQMPDIDSRYDNLRQGLVMRNPPYILFPFVPMPNPTLF